VIGEDVPSTLSPNMYHPRRALKNAINEWLLEFSKKRAAFGVIAKPQPCVASTIPIPIIPSVNTCMSLTSTTTTTTTPMVQVTSTPIVVSHNSNHLQALAEVCSTVMGNETFTQPPSGPVMNSLISETKVVSEPVLLPNVVMPITGTINSSLNILSTEPMDCNTTPSNSPAHLPKAPVQDDDVMVENTFVRTIL
jgi:protein O-GlcNAcase/histone acetyltransferase